MLCAALFCVCCLSLSAQTYSHEDTDLRANLSAGIDWKATKKLHLSLVEEATFDDNLSSLHRLNTTASLSFKACKHFKLGAGYSLLNIKGDESDAYDWRVRHRVYAQASAGFAIGDFRISLRERVQATCKPYDLNTFQQPRVACALRSRIKVSYHLPHFAWRPYASFEIRNTLNAVDCNSLGTSKGTAGTVSYSDVYVNKFRTEIGTEWRLDKNNYLDFSLRWNHLYDKNIDASKKGVYKSMDIVDGNNISLGVAYRFAL